MAKLYGMLRVKNEARWIDRVVAAIRPLCEAVFVMDDNSTDATVELASAAGAVVIPTPFTGQPIHEARDKDWLFERVQERAQVGDWVLCIDGDELLHPDDAGYIVEATQGERDAYALRILYMWNDEQHWRADGVYRKFFRPSLFRITRRGMTFQRTEFGGNFHCSSVPADLIPQATSPAGRNGARLLHFGYLHAEDRIRKYHWYNSVDPDNPVEDNYRHVAQGDLPELPADAQFRWAGPIHLLPLT